MTTTAPADDRLVDLVVCLSGSSSPLARRALDGADPGALDHDPLAAVAAALVALRQPLPCEPESTSGAGEPI
jgi:hypothetical protein